MLPDLIAILAIPIFSLRIQHVCVHVYNLLSQVTCFAEAGGQHVSGMVRAVELLGLRACLTQSIMDSGEGLPASWDIRTTDDCIQVDYISSPFFFSII